MRKNAHQKLGRGRSCDVSYKRIQDHAVDRTFGAALGVALTAAALIGIVKAQTAPAYDIIIRNGHIIDGTGNPWYSGDVAIKDGRIAEIGVLGNATAKRVIDATGMVVTPGYIDLHTHSDLSLI